MSIDSKPHGIFGFTMRTARGGTCFSCEASPERAAFIDRGRVIRVYEHDDEILLATLQLGQWTKALITKRFPAGGIMVSDALDERQYDGVLLGTVSHGGRALALLEWVDNHVIRHDVKDKEMLRRLESYIGKAVVLTCRDWVTTQVEESR